MHDLIIIGAGPAGLSAAIYAARAELDYVLIEENFVNGGQIIDTYEIDNLTSFSQEIKKGSLWNNPGDVYNISFNTIPIELKNKIDEFEKARYEAQLNQTFERE